MKRLFTIALASALTLAGCGVQPNELLDAIDSTYNMENGKVVTTYKYSTTYDNLEVGGDVTGKITSTFTDDYDQVIGNIKFADKETKFKYYIDSKGDVYTVNEKGQLESTIVSPIAEDAPDLSGYIEKTPEPKSTKLKVDEKSVSTNLYTIETKEGLNSDIVNAMFDIIIKLGFVSSDDLSADKIDGHFKLQFYVDPESGQLLKDTVTFSTKDDDNLNTKTNIEISSTYNYDQQTVNAPSEKASEGA